MNNKPILLSKILQYNCFFFDFDGVILESTNIKTEAFLEIYEGTGFEDKIKEYHLANQGISRYVKFRWISEHFFKKKLSIDEEITLGNLFSEIVLDKILRAPFVPGVEQLLAELKKAGKYMVIASGTPQEELETIVEERHLSHFFNEIYGSPNPKKEIVADVIKHKHFHQKECLFLGDASTDFEAAKTNEIHFFTRFTPELANYWQDHIAEYVAPNFDHIS